MNDLGIFSDLDTRVDLPPPSKEPGSVVTVQVDPVARVAVVFNDGRPVAIYPLSDDSNAVEFAGFTFHPIHRGELAAVASPSDVRTLGRPRGPGQDRDRDGIPNVLDLIIGAQKTTLNGADYGAGYTRLRFPGGDVPRDSGVCTDVVIRAFRNAGYDIQQELYRDIARAPRAYPMVKRRNPNIDHRRVRTLLPFFKRRFERHPTKLGDPAEPYRSGDIVFLDTLPRRGPDHIGIVSTQKGPHGRLLIINNWDHGTRTAEMDLLGTISVTHRFRWVEPGRK